MTIRSIRTNNSTTLTKDRGTTNSNRYNDVSDKGVIVDTKNFPLNIDLPKLVASDIDDYAIIDFGNSVAVYSPGMEKTQANQCDWHEIGMCVMIGKEVVDKCQEPTRVLSVSWLEEMWDGGRLD